jgi:hypothetical protein
MLRTPKVPVWLICLNRRYGLMFSTNINLLNNWIYENYFQLHIYTGLKKQEEPCILSIDTRQQYPTSIYGDFCEDNEQRVPYIVQLLETRLRKIKFFILIFKNIYFFCFRWPGCMIENGDEILHELMTLF